MVRDRSVGCPTSRSLAGHDRVPAETKRDQLPNCQRSIRRHEPGSPPRRAPKHSSTASTVNRPACRTKNRGTTCIGVRGILISTDTRRPLGRFAGGRQTGKKPTFPRPGPLEHRAGAPPDGPKSAPGRPGFSTPPRTENHPQSARVAQPRRRSNPHRCDQPAQSP